MNAVAKQNKRHYPVFGDMMLDLFNDDFFQPMSTMGKVKSVSPSVNIKESESKFTIELAVPGMDKKDMNIELDGDQLTIWAERKEESSGETKKEVDENYTMKEFNYSSFRRTFTLPENANEKSIQANYKDGVLMVNIPKKEPDSKKMRTIKIS